MQYYIEPFAIPRVHTVAVNDPIAFASNPNEECVNYPKEIVSFTEDLVSLNLAVFRSLITLRDDGDFLLICEFRWNYYVLRGFLENLSKTVYLVIKQVLLQAGLITEASFRDACKNYVDICFKNQIGWNILHGRY